MNIRDKLKMMFCDHDWKHFRIVTVEEFSDNVGGPADKRFKTIERKCLKCPALWTEDRSYDKTSKAA